MIKSNTIPWKELKNEGVTQLLQGVNYVITGILFQDQNSYIYKFL
jgi:hypothetical protein